MGNQNRCNPPSWADKLLAFYCNPDRLEEVQGDLMELFQERVKEIGIRKARWFYIYDVIRCIRGYSLKRKHKFSNNMILKNYFRIALRNMVRHKSYATINVFGLALGIACFTLIFLFVRHEVSFDQFHEKKDRIYTVPFTWHFGYTSLSTSAATVNVGPILKQEFPEVEEYVRLKNRGLTLIKTENLTAEERGFLYADSSFFNIFSFNLLHGQPHTALVEPYSIILSQSMVDKYFGESVEDQRVLGRMITVADQNEYKVTGIIQDSPNNSHIRFNFLASFSSLRESKGIGSYDNSNYTTYALLHNNVDVAALQTKIDNYILKEFEGEKAVEIGLAPLEDFYLKSYLSSRVGPTSDIKYVYIFSAIAILILLIACINYMNLSTARSMERAKEVGVRKVMGALKNQLTVQFLTESMLITFAAVIIATLMVYFTMPLFNYLGQKQLGFNVFSDPDLLVVYGVLIVVVTLLAGFYPALALSGFSPVKVLRGRFKNSSQGTTLRKILVVFQFSISVILIVGTLVIYRQLDFVKKRNLGYDTQPIISLPYDDNVEEKLDYLKSEWDSYSGIVQSTVVSQLPSKVTFETTFGKSSDSDQRNLMRAIGVDKDFIETMGMELLYGEGFTPSNIKGEYAYIVNEEFCKSMGLDQSTVVGERMQIWGGEWGTVVAVVRNFHFSSMHEAIKPIVIFANEEPPMGRNILVRLKNEDIATSLPYLKSMWEATFDHRPFDYSFLDDSLGALYKTERRLGQMFTAFAMLAVVIGCLGLIGLMSYTTFQRSKEIGIRKVMGASASHIVMLITKNFAYQLTIALAIALPMSYWIMEKWLSGFAYRISISWDILVLASLCTLVVAFITVIYKVLLAALRDPVDTLRSE